MFVRRFLVGKLQQTFKKNVQLYCQNSAIKKDFLKSGKKYASPLITVYQPGVNKINVITLDEAMRLSKRRGLRLIKIINSSKTISNERDEYRLMTEEEYNKLDDVDNEAVVNINEAEIDKEKPKIKDEKSLNMHVRMGEHDIATKVRNIQKWLQKKHQIRIVISATDGNLNSAEKIFDIIAKAIESDGKVVQKRSKNNDLKFQILPTICLKK